jgi:hypothetical protein
MPIPTSKSWKTRGIFCGKYRERRPLPITVPNRAILANLNAFWWIDGIVYPEISGSNHRGYGTPPGA